LLGAAVGAAGVRSADGGKGQEKARPSAVSWAPVPELYGVNDNASTMPHIARLLELHALTRYAG